MAEFQVAVLWLAVYSVGYSAWSLELPHPACYYNALSQLWCEGTNFDIPHSFSVSLIPSTATRIVMTCPGGSQQDPCNMMREGLQPLPHLNELTDVYLYGFKTDIGELVQPNRARIPIPQLLKNVKHRIKHLRIHSSRIGYLDGEFLRGFQSLEVLFLVNNDIDTIDAESLQFLMDPLIPAPSAGLDLPVPKLSKVWLSKNNLQDLDWAVFKPVARTMTDIYIDSQEPGLSSLRRTGLPFTMNLTGLCLNGNSIREIPVVVLDTIALASGGHLYAVDNLMCSSLPSGDCSCCETVNLMRRIERNTKNDPLRSGRRVEFSCGPPSSRLTQNSTFPLAMFEKCPETHTTGVTFPHRSCYTPQPLRIECSLGGIELPSSSRATTDATTVIFESDGRRQCVNILYVLHSKVLEMAGLPTARTAGNDAVQVTCQNGTLRVNENDPDASFADKIIFQADSSLICQDHLHEFSSFVYSLPQNNPGNDESSPVLSIDDWLSDFLICTDAEPLVVNCTAGELASSEKYLALSPAITLLLFADNSLDCRVVLTSMHEHILKQEMVQNGSYAYAAQEDAVVAVAQQGVTVISESHPNKSTKRNLKYYSAPNQLSRNKFRKLLDVLQSFLGSGIV